MDDSDPMVIEHAKEKLLESGEDIIPDLELLAEDVFINPVQSENISLVLSTLRFQRIKTALENWLASTDKNLMQAVFTICTYQFPTLKIEDFRAQL